MAVFVEYESDVEEERGRVKELLEKLRIRAEVLVFWLASGDLLTYEVIINGQSPGLDTEREVDVCLKNQDWWEEIQKIRGKRGETSAIDDLAEVASVLNTGPAWPVASFQQGPRNERAERFLGLRRLLRRSKRRHTMSGITRLGVSLGIRTHRLPHEVMSQHPTNASASEDSASSDDGSSETEVFESDDDDASQGRQSAASEGDIDEYESDSSPRPFTPSRITRRRSHGDSLRGPPPSKKSTGAKEPRVPELPLKSSNATPSTKTPASNDTNVAKAVDPHQRPQSSESLASTTTSVLSTSNKPAPKGERQLETNGASPSSGDLTPQKLEERFTALKNQPRQATPSQRPAISRHSSMPKFSSKPVPITKVATEDGPGPTIMFSDTPSPPPRRSRIPSAYRTRDGRSSFPDHISEVSEDDHHQSVPTSLPRRGSTYSTQAVPLSFNDLPCRAQHLILNELIRQNSADTAVMFTTLPSPVAGTSKSDEASVAYLSDLEVLCKGSPPCLLVHSNSMTVTMSL